MKYAFHPEAEVEFARAVEYYEDREVGLGLDFSVEVFHTIQRMLAHPMAWPAIEVGIRRALVKRFPYGIVYAAQPDKLVVLAVMHLHRDPDYWKGRRQ